MRTYGQNLGEFVSIYRKDMGLTLEQLGEKLGVTKQYVQQVEKSKYRAVPLAFAFNLMRVLDKQRRVWLEDLLFESYQEWIATKGKRRGA